MWQRESVCPRAEPEGLALRMAAGTSKLSAAPAAWQTLTKHDVGD